VVVAALVVACRAPSPAEIASAPRDGISIALYGSYALVDERRTIDVRGPTLELEHVDAGAALASFVIEPIGDTGTIRIGACTRDPLPELPPATPEREPPRRSHTPAKLERASSVPFAPAVRCEVRAPAGRYLVRLVYVSRALHYRAEHEVAVINSGRASVSSRFAITTPAWAARAELAVFDGEPGGAHPPRELARGTAVLDGSIAVLSTGPREVAAELELVYDGAERAHSPGIDAAPASATGWGQESVEAVWTRLEVAHLRLAPGPVFVHVALPGEPVRDVIVGDDQREQANDGRLQLPLWIEPALHGHRERTADYAEGSELSERFLLTVANLGDATRDVWIEEPVRPLRHRRLERPWPGKAVLADDRVRAKVTVAPGKLQRIGFTMAYSQ
jgi:hypothetical protein